MNKNIEQANIEHKEYSVVIEKTSAGKKYRYEVFFEGEYAIFIGESGKGSIVILPDPDNPMGKLEYWGEW